MNIQGAQFHIKLTENAVGRYCLLPGDPARCERIAALLHQPVLLQQNREFTVFGGELAGERVGICSTGIGGASMAIAVEELAAVGVDTMIRIGTCGGIAKSVCADTSVIATAAVRQDGTSREYAPIEYPAVADIDVVNALRQAADALGVRYSVGVVQSKDSFYGQHSPESMPTATELLAKWEAWRRLGVLASEMETAALFCVAAARGLRAGSVLHVIWNQELAAVGDAPQPQRPDGDSVQLGVEALRRLIIADRK